MLTIDALAAAHPLGQLQAPVEFVEVVLPGLLRQRVLS